MPRARKSGAMSATRTGRAQERLSCLLKAASAKEAEHSAVDRSEAECDQRQAGEVLRRESLAEEQPAEQNSNRRDQQRHEQGVGCAGMIDHPEVEDIAKS